jgi:NADH-quinone oxidoreductase subunit N
MKAGLLILIISLLINSVIGLYYYLRVITALFSSEGENKLSEITPWGNVTLTIIAISILILGVYPGWLIDIIVRLVSL